MIPAPLPAIATPQQAWDILGEDVTLRHSLMVREWNEQQQNVSKIDFESNERGDSWYFPDRIDAEIKITDERAQELYDACCEVWEIHGLSKNRAFYRAVFEYSLQPLFDTRQIGLRCDIARYYIFKGVQENEAAPVFLATGMDDLRSKWNTKLEIATRESEARARAARAREAQVLTASLVSPKSKAGRPAKLSPEFIESAASLWRDKQNSSHRVSNGDLLLIARELDGLKFVPPAKFLGPKTAGELRSRNSRSSRSTAGAILSWESLVHSKDKELVRAMRRLMSGTCKNCP